MSDFQNVGHGARLLAIEIALRALIHHASKDDPAVRDHIRGGNHPISSLQVFATPHMRSGTLDIRRVSVYSLIWAISSAMRVLARPGSFAVFAESRFETSSPT